MYSIDRVGADTADGSPVLDACQLGAAGACDVHGAERAAGVDEAVGVPGGVGVVAGHLPGVVDAEGGRAGGERKVDRSERPGPEHKAVGTRGIGPGPDDIAGGVDPGGRGRGGPGEVDGGEGAAAADEPMLGVGRVEVTADDVPGIVDADDLGRAGAGEVYAAEGAALVREAVLHVGQVRVHPDDQAGPIDAGGDACVRARDGEDLVVPAGEGERGRGRVGVAGIEDERPDRGGAVGVENV